MPSPERPQGEGPEQHRGTERALHNYYQAARYESERPARKAYKKAQELVQRETDENLSAYRFYLPDEPIMPNVMVLGVTPSKPVQEQVRRILQDGMPLTVPDTALQTLFDRRAQASQMQPYVEGHWQPGKVFYPPAPPPDTSK